MHDVRNPRGPQVRVDVWRRFKPLASQEKFLRSGAKYRLYSSGYGGGKSKTGCRESIRYALQYPGSRHVVARLHYPDLRDTTMVSFWRECRQIGVEEGTDYTYNKSENTVTWSNGSETLFRNLDDPTGAKYGSLEVSTIFIDEGSEVPDEVYKVLFPSRLRWHLDSCTAQFEIEDAMARGDEERVATITCACPRKAWICTNPGASGYLQDVVSGRMPTDDPDAQWEWFAAKPRENPYNGAEYIRDMEAKGKRYGKAWYARYIEGSWTAFEGQRFPMFDQNRHILPTPFRPDANYTIIEGWDFGHRETFVVWIAYNPAGREPVVVFDELRVNEVDDPSDVADKVKEIRALYRIQGRVHAFGDPAGIAANQFSSVSPIQAYAKQGIGIAPCKVGKNPQARADLLTLFLNENRVQADGSVWPGIVFGPNCPGVINSIISLRWKPQTSRIGEDPREQFVKKDDHGFDALGYGLIAVPPPNTEPVKPPALAFANPSARQAWRAGGEPERWEEL